jgi:tetratricopeptide (TPR) repeat protein
MNVRFEGNNGHDADVTRCLLLTHNGHRSYQSAATVMPTCSASDTVRGVARGNSESQMKSARICLALVVIVASSFAAQAASDSNQSDIDSANRLFEVGKFAEAGELYARIETQDPKNYSAVLQLGRIALLSNRLDDAQKWLEEAIALQPGDDDAKVMLAEAFYRRDNFQRAAASLNGVDVSSDKLIVSQYPTLNVAEFESFKGQTPYEVEGTGKVRV